MKTMTKPTNGIAEIVWTNGCTEVRAQAVRDLSVLGLTGAAAGATRPVATGTPSYGSAAGFSARVATGARIAETTPGTSASSPPT